MRQGWLAASVLCVLLTAGLPTQGQEFNTYDLLLPPAPDRYAYFGQAVAAVPGWVAVGAPGQETTQGSGQVYVYDLSNPAFPTLSLTARSASTQYGASLAWSGDWLFVGDPARGFVEVFKRSGDSFSYVQSLQGQASQRFGLSIASAGTHLVIGAPGANEYSVLAGAGSVYHYRLDGGKWISSSTLSRGGLGAEQQFGFDVAMSGNDLVIGAPARYWSEEVFPGQTWFFERVGNQWIERTRVESSSTFDPYGQVGRNVAIHGDWAIVAGYPLLIGGVWYQTDLSFYKRVGDQWERRDGWSSWVYDVALGPEGAIIGADYSDSIYLYYLNNGRWLREQRLYADLDGLGTAVAWAGKVPVGGAPYANELGTDTGAVAVFGQNKPPIAIGGPDITLEGTSASSLVRLDGSASYDPDGTIVHHEWDMDGKHIHDAVAEVELKPGVYDARLTVYDNDGLFATDHVQVIIKEGPRLVPSFTFSPNKRPPGTPVVFQDQTVDETGVIMRWQWDFDGDGKTDATGMNPTHAFTKSGKHTVALTVTNHLGARGVAERVVTVTNAAPEANAGPDAVVTDDGTGSAKVTLDGTGSLDAEGDISSYRWYEGTRLLGQTAKVDVTALKGVTEYRLDVRDKDGASASDRVRVLVTEAQGGSNGDPGNNGTAPPPPPPPATTVEASFDATAMNLPRMLHVKSTSSATDGEIALWQWTFGSSRYDPGTPEAEWRAPSYGDQQIILQVTALDGSTDQAAVTIRPHNRAPSAALEPVWLAEVPVGAPVVFVDHSEDPEGELASWKWSFGDGGISHDEDIGHIFTAPGTYTIELEVTDRGGLIANATGQVRVLEVPEGLAANWTQEEALAAQNEGRSLLQELQEQEEPPEGDERATSTEETHAEPVFGLKRAAKGASIPMPPWWVLAAALAVIVGLVLIARRR